MKKNKNILWGLRIKSTFSWWDKPVLIVKSIMLAFTCLNALGMAYLIQTSQNPKFIPILFQTLNIGFFIFAIAKDFFPNINRPSYILPHCLPLKASTRIQMLLAFEHVNFSFFITTVFVITIGLFNPSHAVPLLMVLLFFAIGCLVSALIRQAFFYTSTAPLAPSALLAAIAVVTTLFTCFAHIKPTISLVLLTAAYLLLLAVFVRIYGQRLLARGSAALGNRISKAAPLFKRSGLLHLQLSAYGKILTFGFVLKTLILVGNYITLSRKGLYLFNSTVLLYLFISPVLVFSYVFNNLFGYLYTHVNNLLVRKNDTKDLVRLFFQSVQGPLLIDFFISLTMAFLLKKANLDFLLSYLGALSILMALGLWGSFYFPIKIKNKFTFSTYYYASPLVTLICIAVVSGAALLGLRWVYIALLPIAGVIIAFIIKKSIHQKYTLVSKLLINGNK